MANLHPPPLPWNDAPLAPPGRYILQGLMENHAFVGEAVIESAVGWLNAAQIESLLLAAEANLIPISTDPAPEGTTGLFVYNTRAYNDHRMYHHVGPTSLIARQTLVNGDSFVKMGEAIGFNNNRYRKRVHRNFDRFDHLAIIHYRVIAWKLDWKKDVLIFIGKRVIKELPDFLHFKKNCVLILVWFWCLTEIAPPNPRGAFNNGFQVAIIFGFVVATIINYFIAQMKGNIGWRISLGLDCVSAVIIMMIGALNLPDTLNSLIKSGFPEESKQMIRSIQETDEVEEEFQDLIDASEKSKQVKHPWKDISVPRYRPQLIMTCFVPFFQQLTGINVITL
ncbi:hypothetical protein F2Q68_00003221 [Brassica cretica]|uniref:Major facilitator superfamily (MFS) profile domain-containing protein n=1 Tax=Brassica cretica TaxID=69181 RepID=A0A8S9JI66_BRACR|nr:hypothetical protein F2Q68_00003221 [Brassica cretica]